MGDNNNFFTRICVQKEVQPQVSIKLETLRSRVRCVTATLTVGLHALTWIKVDPLSSLGSSKLQIKSV